MENKNKKPICTLRIASKIILENHLINNFEVEVKTNSLNIENYYLYLKGMTKFEKSVKASSSLKIKEACVFQF